MTEKNNNPFNNDIDEFKENENVEEQEVESVEAEEQVTENSNDELVKLKADYDNLNNQYIRLAADFDNFRKRQAQERENLLKYGAEETMKKLLPVLDNFDRGQQAIAKIEDCQQVKDSFNLVCNQMSDTLAKAGLEVIECQGQEFDPNFHEAVMQTLTDEYPENTIIAELQKGYKIGDKVLRAALVNVAVAQ